MKRESAESKLSRRSFAALFGAAFLLSGITRPAPVHIPEAYLEDLRQMTRGEGGRMSNYSATGNYLDEENYRGGDISEAIMQLEGINPDLAASQISQLLYAPSWGGSLSQRERRAIVYLSNTWPDEFEPYFRGEGAPHTRAELVQQLSLAPALRGVFERYDRRSAIRTAESESRN